MQAPTLTVDLKSSQFAQINIFLENKYEKVCKKLRQEKMLWQPTSDSIGVFHSTSVTGTRLADVPSTQHWDTKPPLISAQSTQVPFALHAPEENVL